MAFVGKNVNAPRKGAAVLAEWIQVSRVTASLPQSTTDILFRVFGGRVLVHLIVGEVTTIIQAQATTVKLTGKKLDGTPAAVGTAVDLCATADGNAKEVGSLFIPLGSGAAAIWSNAGSGLGTLGRIPFIQPQGEIYMTTGASSTGAMKWDLWFQPLDAGAYVTASAVAAAI